MSTLDFNLSTTEVQSVTSWRILAQLDMVSQNITIAPGVYVDKRLTRIVGGQAPRINTTIGYRLSEKRRI